ncbi:MAG: hypothetical protein ACI39N_02700, partial [Lachnospiraceae bacterium]
WYMVSDLIDDDSTVRVNRKMELVRLSSLEAGNSMVGISYLIEDQAKIVRERVCEMAKDVRYNDAFWEEALYDKNKLIVQARIVHAADGMRKRFRQILLALSCLNL